MAARLPSGLLAAAAAALVLWWGGWVLTLCVLFLALFALHEYVGLLSHRGVQLSYGPLALAGALLVLLPPAAEAVLVLGAAAYVVLEVARGRAEAPQRSAFAVLGLVYIPWFLSFAQRLRALESWGAVALALVVAVSASTDTGAYSLGSWLGRAKLAPHISPGKTVAGAFGGILAGALASPLGASLARASSPLSWPALVVVGLCVSLCAQVGDLSESQLKRFASVKDSGRFLPGHGGVLDRIDGLLLALPVAYYLVRFLGG